MRSQNEVTLAVTFVGGAHWEAGVARPATPQRRLDLAAATALAVACHLVLLVPIRSSSVEHVSTVSTAAMQVRVLPAIFEVQPAAAMVESEAKADTAGRQPAEPKADGAEPPLESVRLARSPAAPPADRDLRVAVNSSVRELDPPMLATPPASSAVSRALPPAPEYLFAASLDPGPRPLEDIVPEYPAEGELQEGTVALRLLISETGHVDNVAVVRSYPVGLFDRAAITAFSNAKFAPALLLGVPTKSQITIEVHFAPFNRGAKVSGRGY